MTFKKILVFLFFAILILVPMATFLLPKQSYSELENRELAAVPHPTAETVMDKSFMQDAEEFMSDHILFRNEFVSARTKLELASGKREINGVFIGGNRLMENVPEPDADITEGNLKAINTFAEKHSDTLDTTVMLVPTAVQFYPEELPAFAEAYDQLRYIQNFYSGLTDASGTDVSSALAANSDSYIYYRTDHHWTSYGAYLGYTALSRNLGFRAITLDNFNIEHVSYDFLGTLYSKVLCKEELKDGIDLYSYSPGDPVQDVIKYNGRNTVTYSSIFFRKSLETKDQYEVFLGENNAVVRITTNVKNGKKLLVFKDSYANSMMQFLPLHYQEITLVDPRYMTMPLSDFIDIEDYDQALFLYNVGTFTDNKHLYKVAQY